MLIPEQIKELWEMVGVHEKPVDVPKYSPDTGARCYPTGAWRYPDLTLDNLFKYVVPKAKIDAIWIINNLDSPTPGIGYCAGFVRGKDNDMICWSKKLPIEDCLSPIYDDPAQALAEACYKALEVKDGG